MSNEEFIKKYKELFDGAGFHQGDKKDEQKVKEYEEKVKERKEAFHKTATYNDTTTPILKEDGREEKWVSLEDIEGYTRYSVSDFGRVMWKGKILKQDAVVKEGYLRLDPDGEKQKVDHFVNVYTLIAMGFLGKRLNDGYDVHHLNNNGYNCRPENLILLTRKQHEAVHAKAFIEDIRSFLEEDIN